MPVGCDLSLHVHQEKQEEIQRRMERPASSSADATRCPGHGRADKAGPGRRMRARPSNSPDIGPHPYDRPMSTPRRPLGHGPKPQHDHAAQAPETASASRVRAAEADVAAHPKCSLRPTCS